MNFEDMFGKPGEAVPEVDPADMRKMLDYQREARARHPAGNVAVSSTIYEKICSPGANLRALGYRLGMLGLLEMMLESTWSGGRLTNTALQVAAKMPLQWMEVGKTYKSFPFDVREFLGEVHARANGHIP